MRGERGGESRGGEGPAAEGSCSKVLGGIDAPVCALDTVQNVAQYKCLFSAAHTRRMHRQRNSVKN